MSMFINYARTLGDCLLGCVVFGTCMLWYSVNLILVIVFQLVAIKC